MLIGFDIGGTKIEVCVLDNSGNTQFKKRTPTPQTYSDLLAVITALVEEAEHETGQSCSVGIGLPGTLSPSTGLMKNANCTFINGHDLLADLQQLLGRPVSIANDANCFALSEAVDGAGEADRLVFGAILGTGCGGGIVFNKTIWAGPNALGGEWGHNPLPGYSAADGEARPCYCGRDNCIEQFISGTGLEITYKKLTGQPLAAPAIIDAKRNGEPAAGQAYAQMLQQMARSFAALINTMDPDTIVLGGGLSNVDELYTDLPAATQQYVFGNEFRTQFKKARFGDSSGIRGAARLALQP